MLQCILKWSRRIFWNFIAVVEGVGAGPFVNREHLSVAIVESHDVEKVDRFIVETRLAQWNTVHVLPSKSIQEGMAELNDQPPMF